MGTRLHHPISGGEFDAPDSAVPHYQRSGWMTLADWKAHQARNNGGDHPAAPVIAKTAGKAEASTKE